MPRKVVIRMTAQAEGGEYMLCAFTGHRPQHLPWGSREEDPRCQALKQLLDRAIGRAVELGCDRFLCGMALGCDLYFAEAVLARGLPLEAVLPCPGQADRWAKADRARYETLLLRCDAIRVLEDSYTEGCMLRRNRAMVELADYLITVYDGSGGGTGSTIAYAKKRGVELIPVWI